MNDPIYYDTCIFLLQCNRNHRECDACAILLDSRHIQWTVAYSALSRHEAPIGELLDAFEIQCALNGAKVLQVTLDHSAALTKEYLALKKSLAQCGPTSRDWKHLMAATWAGASTFLTDDRDFWDPASKRKKGTHPRNGRVRRLIRRDLGIVVHLPSSWLAEIGLKL